jgi:aspartate racemase
MKTIGLLGGVTWESTLEYYRRLNLLAQQRYGDLHSAACLLYSFDFQELADLQNAGRWGELGDLLAGWARRLEQAGAGLLLICANTLHKVAARLRQEVGVPLVHIVEETARAALQRGFARVGLLGTRITMEDGFYAEGLEARGLKALLPPAPQRSRLDRIIFEELALGRLEPASRQACLAMAGELVARGAQAVILGCTELPLLLQDAPASAPWLDSLEIHVRAAFELAAGPAVGGSAKEARG